MTVHFPDHNHLVLLTVTKACEIEINVFYPSKEREMLSDHKDS